MLLCSDIGICCWPNVWMRIPQVDILNKGGGNNDAGPLYENDELFRQVKGCLK